MKHGALVALCVAAAFAVAQAQATVTAAQSGAYPNFPYCQCIKSPSPYSFDQTITSYGNGTYCFTLNVTPVPGATGYCAARADIKKIEFNVNTGCRVFGAVARGTINGKPTPVGSTITLAEQGPVGSTILRFTQLNLNLGSDGTLFCVTLGLNSNGVGCDTLEELCVPPAGAPPGACAVALFDNKQDCCPISNVNVPSPPPAPPSPPPPPPPPPAETTCKSCSYITFAATNPLFPVEISKDQCDAMADLMISTITYEADEYGAVILPGQTTYECYPDAVKVCLTFASQTDGQKLQDYIQGIQTSWLNEIYMGACPAFLAGVNVVANTAADGPDPFNPPASSCLSGTTTAICQPKPPSFPKCECDTKPAATPFAATPYLTELPGRPNPKYNTSLYCFTLMTVQPSDRTSACGSTTNLLKAEIWGNDIPTQRRKIISVGIQASDWPKMRWQAPSWGKPTEQTIKASPLNWSLAQADGALICLELTSATDLNTFCMYGSNTCWINFFNDDKKCCPLFPATLVGY